ncbi:MAG: 3-keto-5-aminohexanoate cleavage protein [Desulfobacteraceae bacterium 4572_89]|nr:MAG: 3-keto-5-aminohexanoate cleavage protein [Desulfobacteraceae bacterium 4572_89]
MDNKIIITAAITGSVHIPTMSDYLPITPDEIVEDAVRAWEAGAAIAHIHVRNPENGMPVSDPDLFMEVHTKIKERCNLVLLPTTGGGMNQTTEEKLIPIKKLEPEMCSFDPAPFNFGIFQIAGRFKEFKNEWEKEYLELCKNVTFRPTFNDDIIYAKTFLEIDTKPEFEIYELGHVSYVKWLMEENLVKTPVHLQFVFGPMVGWMTPSVKHLVLIHDEAKEVLGEENFTWSVAAGGRFQIPITTTAIAMGAQNVRVGLEDSIYAGKGVMAKASADQVTMIKNVAKEMSLLPATSDEAREILGLKGLDKVNF